MNMYEYYEYFSLYQYGIWNWKWKKINIFVSVTKNEYFLSFESVKKDLSYEVDRTASVS